MPGDRLSHTAADVSVAAGVLLTWVVERSAGTDDPIGAELLQHTADVLDTAHSWVESPGRGRPLGPAAQWRALAPLLSRPAPGSRPAETASSPHGARLGATIDRWVNGLAPGLPAIVATPVGSVRTLEALHTVLVELTLSADDTGRTQGWPEAPLGRRVLGTATRTLTEVLASDHPGQTVEVRVPPYAAVQIGFAGDGPTHTRGTPPNVVETDPATFWRLATGRVTWADASSQGLVRASGVRADLQAILPLLPG